MAGRNYGTDPYGIISRGDPSARGGSSVSVGRVGSSVRDYSNPGRSFGAGVGATLRLPMKYKSKAKGGAIKKSGCEVKAYGDMIKKAAGGKVQTSSDTARKLATEMGGMKKGGIQKKAVGGMPQSAKTIADTLRGKARPVAQATDPRRPMPTPPVRPTTPPPVRPGRPTPMPVRPEPKPVNNAHYDLMRPVKEHYAKMRAAERAEKEAALNARMAGFKDRIGAPKPVKKAEPIPLAKGGAGKVRKGMMSPQGAILQVVKPKKGGM